MVLISHSTMSKEVVIQVKVEQQRKMHKLRKVKKKKKNKVKTKMMMMSGPVKVITRPMLQLLYPREVFNLCPFDLIVYWTIFENLCLVSTWAQVCCAKYMSSPKFQHILNILMIIVFLPWILICTWWEN